MTDPRAVSALATMAAEDARRLEEAWTGKDVDRSWHLLQTGARWNSHARQKLVSKQFEVYQPIMMRPRRVPLRKLSHAQRSSVGGATIMKLAPAPVFDSYCFIRFSMKGDPWRDLFRFVGVYGLLCEDDLPVAVPDAMVQRLRGLEVRGIIPTSLLLPELFWERGEVATVIDGPFAGALVEVDVSVRLDQVDESEPLRCLLAALGRKVPVGLLPSQLQKL